MPYLTFFVFILAACFNSYGQNSDVFIQIRQKIEEKKYEEAIVNLRKLETSIYKEHQDYPLLCKYFGMAHSGNYDEAEAEVYFRKALEVYSLREGSTSHNSIEILSELGSFYFRFNDFKAAIEEFNLFLLHGQSTNYSDTLRFYGAHSMCSYAYRRLGDFSKALEHLKKNEILFRKYNADKFQYARLNYNYAGVYYEMNEYQKSTEHYEACIVLWEKEFEKFKKPLKAAYSAAGDMYWKLGNRERALYMYDKEAGLKLMEEGSYDPEIENDVQKKEQLKRVGDYERLLSYFRDAMDYRMTMYGEDHPVVAGCNNYVADALLNLGKEREALQAYQRSIGLLVENFNDTSIFRLPSADGLIYSELYLLEAIEAKAGIFYKLYFQTGEINYLELAHTHLNYAIEVLDGIRMKDKSENSEMFWSGRAFSIFEFYIQCCYELFKLFDDLYYCNQAFLVSEKSKSYQVLEALRRSDVLRFSGVPEKLLEREKVLEQQINEYRQKIFFEGQRCGEISNYKIDLWNSELYEVSAEYEVLISLIKKRYPDYYELRHTIPQPDYTGLQTDVVRDKSVLVEFFYGMSAIYTFYIGSDNFAMRRVTLDSSLRADCQFVIDFCSDIDEYQSNPSIFKRKYISKASSIYKLFFASWEDWNADNYKDLIIVPDGILHYLPFEVLLTEAPAAGEELYSDLPYLINKLSVSYINSAAILSLENRSGTIVDYRREFAGFAPEYNPENFKGGRRPDANVSSLIYNRSEVEMAASMFESLTCTGSKATRENFKTLCKDSKILHIAAHTLIEDEEPLFSSLLFAGDSLEQMILYAYELYGMNFNSDLVVLSACNTGVGKIIMGEGVMSLSRAFLYAGVKGLLVSLWTIDDKSTSLLMNHFYSALKSGNSKSESLRQSKLTFLKEADPAFSHPFYWAGFKFIGEDSKLAKSRLNYKYLILFVIFGFSITIYFFNRLERIIY